MVLSRAALHAASSAAATCTPLRAKARGVPRRWSPGTPRLPRRTLKFGGANVPRQAPARCIRSEGVRAAADIGELEFNAFSGFSDREETDYAIGIMGDLHLEPEQMHLFHQARDQITSALVELTGTERKGRIVQLGDLGGYTCAPGSRECFEASNQFLTGFRMPVGIITGNHDLEGAEFETDEENLVAWKSAFSQEKHYWSKDLGRTLLIGLSTIRFRSNNFSVHEVFIDEDQIEWLNETLAQNSHRPVVIFSHAPPMGCGLKVVQNVHVKNRCAWLNHSSDPGVFIRLVQQHPNIRLWFSGHFHLSHNYADSISVQGNTAFVQTGVIGECNRDGLRQSRVLKLSNDGYTVYTIDHDDGKLRLDLEHLWGSASPPQPVELSEEMLCDPEAGYLCAVDQCAIDLDWRAAKINMDGTPVRWIFAGGDVMLANQNDMLVEYKISLQSPYGVVCLNTAGRSIRMVDSAGKEVPDEDATEAVAVEIVDSAGQVERIERNERNSFFRIFQPNKWRLKKEKAAREVAGAVA